MPTTFGGNFRTFGRQIFKLYEAYPLTLNSLVGATVYVGGEVVSQVQQNSHYKPLHDDDGECALQFDVRQILLDLKKDMVWHAEVIDWGRARQIGTLGAIENGVFMLAWYRTLSKLFGDGISTKTVLIKCICDQIFFATQQDFLFLSLCAYSDTRIFTAALDEVQRTFLSTWLIDCSLWPLVNFIGFAAVPYVLLPSYIALVQFFWQVYVSGIAAKDAKHHTHAETPFKMELQEIFHKIDTDKSGYIDAIELNAFVIKRQGKKLSKEQLKFLIKEADIDGDNRISYDEFERIILINRRNRRNSSSLWSTVHDDVALVSSTQNALKRFKQFHAANSGNSSSNGVNSSSSNVVNSSNPIDEETLHEQLLQYKADLDVAIYSACTGLSVLSLLALTRRIVFKI